MGHLREEKDPRTLWNALRLIDPQLPIRIRHIGEALDPVLGDEARAAMARDSRYRWTGALPHGLTRCAIRDAHLLVHPSLMEGGANVIVEAVNGRHAGDRKPRFGQRGHAGEELSGLFRGR